MKQARGIYVSESEFVAFADQTTSLTSQIATRSRSMDMQALGMYLPNPDPVLRELGLNIKAYRDLRVDAHVGGCIRRRKAAVKSLEWGFDQASQSRRGAAPARVAKAVQDIFARLDMARIIAQMLEASLYGYQPIEVMWEKRGGLLVPQDLIAKPPEWFVFDDENTLRFRSRDNGTYGELLPERKFLLPRQEPTYDNPYGQADLAMVFWPTTFKKGGLKFWVQFTEKYGMPFLIGKQPRCADDEDTDRLLNQLEAMIQDAVAVIPDDSSVELQEAAGKSGSAEVYEKLILMCRSEVSIALLGSNSTTEKNGTHASASTGLEVAHEIRDGDAEIVCSAINQLVDWIVDLNFGDAIRPVFSMWEQEEVDTLQAERDEKLTRAGAKFTNAYFCRAYSLQENDLAPQQTAANPLPADSKPADPAFAESSDSGVSQSDLDAAITALTNGDMASQALAAMLDPIRAALASATDLPAAQAALDAAIGDLDAQRQMDLLTRALFVAQAAGRLSVAQEAHDHAG